MSTVLIEYDSTDITDEIVLGDARFTSAVNGNVGNCFLRVKDPNRDKTFTIGRPLRLLVDGSPVWTGTVQSVRRSYAFPYENTTVLGDVTRYLIIDGVDLNILFRKRFLFNQTTPTNLNAKIFPATPDTADTTAIAYLIANYIDLSGDNLDTTSKVQHVGNVNLPEQPTAPFSLAYSWGTTMDAIARFVGAVYYITPARELVFADVDIEDAPFVLSDTTGPGYREMRMLHDGSGLINDALVWSAGGGSPIPLFDRIENASSIAEHGRWQYGRFYGGVWKAATLARIGNSLVYGSPQSHRGASHDRVSVELVVYEPGLIPGMKVDFTSEAFGYTDIIPIRRMDVTFVNPTTPRYSLVLSHEVDLPLEGLIDPILIKIPGGKPPPPLPPVPPCIDCEPCLNCGGCTYEDYEDFNTDFIGEWNPVRWVTDSGNDVGVDSGVGFANIPSGDDDALFFGSDAPATSLVTFLIRMRCSNFPLAGASGAANSMLLDFEDNNNFNAAILIGWSNTEGAITVYGETGNTDVPKLDWELDAWYFIRWQYEANGTNKLKVWLDGDTEPDWQATIDNTGGPAMSGDLFWSMANGDNTATYDTRFEVDYIQACAENEGGSPACDELITSMSGWARIGGNSPEWDFADGELSGTWIRSGDWVGGGSGETWSYGMDVPRARVLAGVEATAKFSYAALRNIGTDPTENEGLLLASLSFSLPGPDVTARATESRTPFSIFEAVLPVVGTVTGYTFGIDEGYDSGNTWTLRIGIKDGECFAQVDELTGSRVTHAYTVPPASFESGGIEYLSFSTRIQLFAQAILHSGATQTVINTGTATLNTIAVTTSYDDICTGEPVEEEPSTSTGGTACETFSGSNATAYQLENPYLTGTVSVTINGLFQIPNLHWAEDDPADGTIFLASSPQASDEIRICYQADTTSGGGGGAFYIR